MAEQAEVQIRQGNWESVQTALANPNHLPIVVFVLTSDHGRGTPDVMRRAAKSFVEQGGPAIIVTSYDPAILEANGKMLKKENLANAAGATIVYKNGGDPEIHPYPRCDEASFHL